MTIASTTSRIGYTGDGVTTTFAVPFIFQLNTDLVSYLQDTSGNTFLQTFGTNYSLTGATLAVGGTLTFFVAPPLGYLISIYRDPALTQTTSYNNNDPFPAKSHELALDKTVTIDQRTRDIALRGLHLPDAESSATVTTLANIATRANKLLGFDQNGSVIYSVGPAFVGNISTNVAEVDTKQTAQLVVFGGTVNVVHTYGGIIAGDGLGLDYIRGTGAGSFTDGGGVSWVPATPTNKAYSLITGIPALLTSLIAGFTTTASIWSTGDVKPTYKQTADAGWLLFDDTTFGSAASGASNRANADTQTLFNLFYAAPFTDASVPLLTSAGGATTRGAQGTAAAAFAANCRMSLPKTLGRALGVGGAGSGLTSRTVGAVVGQETQTLGTPNLPPYTPAGTNAAISVSCASGLQVNSGGSITPAGGGVNPVALLNTATGLTSTGAAPAFTGSAQGGTSAAFAIMDPTTYMNAMVKL